MYYEKNHLFVDEYVTLNYQDHFRSILRNYFVLSIAFNYFLSAENLCNNSLEGLKKQNNLLLERIEQNYLIGTCNKNQILFLTSLIQNDIFLLIFQIFELV